MLDVLHRLTKEHKGHLHANTHLFFKRVVTNIRISALLLVDGTWIYKFQQQRRFNNKQWLCKDQARHVIMEEQEAGEKGLFALVFQSEKLIVQV